MVKQVVKVSLEKDYWHVRYRSSKMFKKGTYFTLDDKDSKYIRKGCKVRVARTIKGNRTLVQSVLVPKDNKEIIIGIDAIYKSNNILKDLGTKSTRKLK